jgi:restriction endonuclease S subunit
MNQKYKIKDIAKIIIGYTFRTALNTQTDGAMSVVQAKDIADGFEIDESKLSKISYQKYKTDAILQTNDVIVSARGNFRAGVFKGEMENAIASSSVYILRLKSDYIVPEFLSIYLNLPISQRRISKSLTGGAIKTILRKDLADLEISVPNLNDQEKIIKIYKNNKKQQELLKQEKFFKNKITEGLINNILNH